MVALCVPVSAVSVNDVDPTGRSLANVNAPYLTAGGGSSTTQFLTSADFASHALTILNVWSNGCGPCVNEMPYFQRVHENYASRGILVVGICTEWVGGTFAAEWNYLQNNGYTYTNVIYDTVLYNLATLNNFIPQTFFVNREGVVVDFIGGSATYNNLVNKINQWAEYDEVYYDVSFVDGVTGEVFATQSVLSGSAPTYPQAPVHEGYTFTGWSPATPPTITGPTTITANYSINTYTVRFFDSMNGSLLSSRTVQHGAAAHAPDHNEYPGYEFIGWDKDFSCVTSDMDVYTVYAAAASEPGDVDGNGTVTMADVSILAMYLNGEDPTISQSGMSSADANGDGTVDIRDIATIYLIIANS